MVSRYITYDIVEAAHILLILVKLNYIMARFGSNIIRMYLESFKDLNKIQQVPQNLRSIFDIYYNEITEIANNGNESMFWELKTSRLHANNRVFNLLPKDSVIRINVGTLVKEINLFDVLSINFPERRSQDKELVKILKLYKNDVLNIYFNNDRNTFHGLEWKFRDRTLTVMDYKMSLWRYYRDPNVNEEFAHLVQSYYMIKHDILKNKGRDTFIDHNTKTLLYQEMRDIQVAIRGNDLQMLCFAIQNLAVCEASLKSHLKKIKSKLKDKIVESL